MSFQINLVLSPWRSKTTQKTSLLIEKDKQCLLLQITTAIANYDNYYKLQQDNKNLSLQNKGTESTPQFFRFRFWLRVRKVHWTFEERAPRGLLMVFKGHEHVAKNDVCMSVDQISLKHFLIERLWGCLHGQGGRSLYQEDPRRRII